MKTNIRVRMQLIAVLVVVLAVSGTALATTTYTSNISFRAQLDGTSRKYYEKNLQITCSDTSSTLSSGFWYIYDDPITFDVKLKKGLTNCGTVYGFPMSTQAYVGTWNNANPSESSNFKFCFYANGNDTFDGHATEGSLITGDIEMKSYN